jgi:hypothetical protein
MLEKEISSDYKEYGKMKATAFHGIRAPLRKTFFNVREGAGIKENL